MLGGWAPMTCTSIWLITMVIVESSPKDRVVGPLPNELNGLLVGGFNPFEKY